MSQQRLLFLPPEMICFCVCVHFLQILWFLIICEMICYSQLTIVLLCVVMKWKILICFLLVLNTNYALLLT